MQELLRQFLIYVLPGGGTINQFLMMFIKIGLSSGKEAKKSPLAKSKSAKKRVSHELKWLLMD